MQEAGWTGDLADVMFPREREYLCNVLFVNRRGKKRREELSCGGYRNTKSALSISRPHLLFFRIPPFPTTAHFLNWERWYGMSCNSTARKQLKTPKCGASRSLFHSFLFFPLQLHLDALTIGCWHWFWGAVCPVFTKWWDILLCN